jgi:hypothetical protein
VARFAQSDRNPVAASGAGPEFRVSSGRDYYTSNVVGRVLASSGSTQVLHNYESVPGAVPIPATLSHELGRIISEQQQNITYRLFQISRSKTVRSTCLTLSKLERSRTYAITKISN